MSDELRELRSEIIALKEINSKLEGENSELKEKTNKLEEENDKLKEENAALKAGSSQQKLSTSAISIPTSQPVKRSQESEPSECTPNIKRPKTIKEIYLDEQIVNFIKNIAHMLQNCLLCFNIGFKMDKKKVIFMRALLECLAEKIFKFTFNGPTLGEFFNKVFPGILDYIQSIKYDGSILDIYEIDDILNWLTKQSNYGKQKTLELWFCCGQKFMIMTTFFNRIKEEFSNSNSPSNFIVFYSADWVHEEFTLENARTNEILTLYCKLDSLFYLARYPKGEEYWKEFGEKKIHQIHDYTIINIDACCLVNMTCSDKRCQ